MNEDSANTQEPSPSFARTPGRDIFGPLDDTLPEIRINADVKLRAMRAANELGLDVTTWMRELVYASLFEPEHLARMHQERFERVLGNARQKETVELRVVDPTRSVA